MASIIELNGLKVGDRVTLSFGFVDHVGSGNYEVLRILPPAVDGEVQYRVRGDDGYERAIGHRQILGVAHKRAE
ncbi:hypothetical protein [Bosea sp. PAMC 26642]|uniref:hypothetical protein n=1 Tax=Bosea sp. (strain PAMC 26642) TaxID=1792307 RepID=UPI000770034C|nr:hypothetical protein [Bosea sp. PAMC 26642]AMJ60962.1 hypothetical protein AXW83_12230 [Bosea sp. PAMC 26642]